MRYEIYRSGAQYRWRLWSANNRIVADSGEAYVNKSACQRGIQIMQGLTSIDYFHFYVDAANQWRWRVKSTNGNIIADSAEGYTSKEACEHGARLVLNTNVVTQVIDNAA